MPFVSQDFLPLAADTQFDVVHAEDPGDNAGGDRGPQIEALRLAGARLRRAAGAAAADQGR